MYFCFRFSNKQGVKTFEVFKYYTLPQGARAGEFIPAPDNDFQRRYFIDCGKLNSFSINRVFQVTREKLSIKTFMASDTNIFQSGLEAEEIVKVFSDDSLQERRTQEAIAQGQLKRHPRLEDQKSVGPVNQQNENTEDISFEEAECNGMT